MPSVVRACLVMLAFPVILMIIACATAATEIDKKVLEVSFSIIDTNKDNKISFNELEKHYKRAGLNEKQIDTMFEQADANGDGVIDKAEFVKSFGDKNFPRGEKEEVLKSMFYAIDTDYSGYIDLAKLIKYYNKLGTPYTKAGVEKYFKELDKDSDGVVTFIEFEQSVNGV